MLYIKLFIEREKNIGQSAPECPFKLNCDVCQTSLFQAKDSPCVTVEFYLYPTVGTVLIHSAKPELTE